MKLLPTSIGLLVGLVPVFSQEPDPPHQDLEILGPITTGAPSPEASTPVLPEFAVVKSRTTRAAVAKTAEFPELPSIQGIVNVTVQRVRDPGLSDPAPPPLPLPPDDPAVVARKEELRRSRPGWNPVILSATVHDHARSLLRISLNGKPESRLTAWSNIDFNHFSGFAGYRIKEGDGSTRDCRWLPMGIGNIDTGRMRAVLARQGKAYKAPDIPPLPDLTADGPAFVVVEGDRTAETMNALAHIHDLYRKEGRRLADAFLARTQAHEERKAFLLANPPEPEDVKIQVWKREKPLNTQEGGSVR
ncbi:hypothetical protein [Luteolibacter sp. Populi]|uniref:hypothetical protein n=1 Tax=Luteolibacter sp. Populi TaxID=3230487 RepID=UPI003465D8B2